MENHDISPVQAGGLEFEGVWNVQLFDKETGEMVLDQTQHNIVVDNAVVFMAKGNGPSDFSSLHLGNAPFPTTPNVTDLALNADFFVGTTVHKNISKNSTFAFQKKCSLKEIDAVGTITEAGLFSSNSTMFNRVLLNPPVIKTATQTGFVNVSITIRRV